MKQRSARIYAHVTPAEHEEVTALAKQARLTTSELVRRLVTGRRLPDASHHETVVELGRINANLAWLGNLLRMALDDPDYVPPEGMDLEQLFDKIRDTQSTLRAKIEEL